MNRCACGGIMRSSPATRYQQGDRRREDRGHLGQRHHREPLPANEQQHAGDRQAPQLRARGRGPPTRRHGEREPGDQEDQRRPAERRPVSTISFIAGIAEPQHA
jgi:hypothetical protein